MHIGSSISHYKIVEKLGEGGMGVVYKAEDTKLNRQVALKFLAQHLLNDPEAKERFLREAQAAAALHHANICPVHEIDEVDGKTFISMAYIEGETLEDKIARGPLAIKEALEIGQQIAKGLQAAHEKAIVHRDVKPANVLVAQDGQVTIMDFGLARLTEASRLTKVDTAMGTVAYMSPEQAQGMDVDHRSDVWALGCVLYEMVSGQRPFQGQYDQALLYEIVHEQVAPLTSIRAGVPMELEFIVGKCLAKDREDRHQAAKEVAVDLRTLAEKLKSGHSTILRTAQMTGAVPATMTAAHTLNPTATLPSDAVVVGKRRLQTVYGLAAAFAVAFFGVTAVLLTQTPPQVPEQPTRRFSLSPEGLTAAGISPDGRYIAFTVGTPPDSSLWLRAVGSETAREIPGTQGARPVADGWSPDSQAIVFATTNEIKRVAIDGGDPITLADLLGLGGAGFRGVSWSPDGERIVFSSRNSLWEIAARGGEPKPILEFVGSGLVEPHFLPTNGSSDTLVYESNSRIWVLNLGTGESSEIGQGSAPVYSPAGYLILESGDENEPGLRALPFSLVTLKPTGEAFPIVEGGAGASVAQDGTLAYLDSFVAARDTQTLVWRSRAGESLEAVGQPQPSITQLSLSPDGRRVAVSSTESGNADIWVHDLTRSTKTRLTFEEVVEDTPTWSPDGREIAYHAEGPPDRIMRRAADGTGEPVVLVDAEFRVVRPDWSRDGRYLVYDEFDPPAEVHNDIRYIELGTDGQAGEPAMFVGSPADEQTAKLSHDGRFLAYESDESGRYEIYVRPFPDGAGKWQASVNGGVQPVWSPVGNELYYVQDSTLMAVSVSTESGFTLGRQTKLFQSVDLVGGGPSYDVSADGQRFLTVASAQDGDEQEEETAPPKIRLVQNWYEEFRGREQ